MAHTKHIINNTSFGTDIATILTNKYGAGVTIYESTASSIIFSIPSICNKVIKFYSRVGAGLTAFFGDSNETVTNIIFNNTFVQDNNSNYAFGAISSCILFASEKSLIAYFKSVNNKIGIVILAKGDSGNFYAIGLATAITTSNNTANMICTNLNTLETFVPKGLNYLAKTADNKLLKIPILLLKTDNSVFINGNTVEGLDIYTSAYVNELDLGGLFLTVPNFNSYMNNSNQGSINSSFWIDIVV